MFKLNFIKSLFRKYISSLFKDIKVIVGYSLKILRKYRPLLFKASFLKVLSFPLGLSIIYITKITLDNGIFAKNLNIFLIFSLLGLAIFFLTRLFQYLTDKLLIRVRAKFSTDVNYDMTKRLFGLDYHKLKELSSAENSFILDYDYHVIENLVLDELPSLISLVKIPVFFILAFMLSAPLTLLVLIALPFMAISMIWASRRRREYRVKVLHHTRKHHSVLHDILLNIKLIKSFFKENWALQRVNSLFRDKVGASAESSAFLTRVRLVSDLLSKLNTVIFWLLGGYLMVTDRLSFGSFSAVTMYTAMIISEMDNLSSVIQELNEERPSIIRSAAFITKISNEQTEPALSKNVTFDTGIKFENVTFGYNENNVLFKDLSFAVPAGKWTLIRGISGIGKTSLLSLFLRLFALQDGKILIGNDNIERIDRSVFFNNISVVHQEPYLFNDTIVNNVLLGEERKSEIADRAIYCSKLDGLVGGMPLGYNTRVGEGGFNFSGGEKQRVAIARALAREPKILIMDEATSFLDISTESEIFKNIKELFPFLTVIFVTHRETSGKHADEILTLREGKIFKESEMLIN